MPNFVSNCVPSNWSIVTIGAWNQAILTPDGIRKRLFNLSQDVPVAVEIPVDRPAPFRVRYEGIIVSLSASSLEVAMDVCSTEYMVRAREVACNALMSLPETPVAAVGINFRYKLPKFTEFLSQRTKNGLDDTFSDLGYEIRERRSNTFLKLDEGVINVELSQGTEGDGALLLNFHCDSQDSKALRRWLERVENFAGVKEDVLRAMELVAEQEEEESDR